MLGADSKGTPIPYQVFDFIDERPNSVHFLIDGYTYVYSPDSTFAPVNYRHWVTNAFRPDQNLIGDGYWWTSKKTGDDADAEVRGEAQFPDGKYRVVVGAKDIKGNGLNEAKSKGAESIDVIVNNFAPDGKRIKAEKSPASYDAEWVRTSGNKQELQVHADNFTNAGLLTITIEFGEPVEDVVLRVGALGAIPIASIQGSEMRTIWKATVPITDENHKYDGTQPIKLRLEMRLPSTLNLP